jgi:hypothetical protein
MVGARPLRFRVAEGKKKPQPPGLGFFRHTSAADLRSKLLKSSLANFSLEVEMKMATPLSVPNYWYRCAGQCRARAAKIKDPIIRVRMLMIAEGYDRIAQDTKKVEARKASAVHLRAAM